MSWRYSGSTEVAVVGVGVVRVVAPRPPLAGGTAAGVVAAAPTTSMRCVMSVAIGPISPVSAPNAFSEGEAGRVSMFVVM